MRMGFIGLALCVGLIAGCSGGGGGNTCGDGVCDGGETYASCPSDCPASGPFCGDGTCNGNEITTTCAADCGAACSATNDNCAGETICVASACVAAFPRVYSITNVMVSVPTTNPNNNSSWDVGGGAPDLFLGDSAGTAFSAIVQDQFSATFAGPFDVQLTAGQTLLIDVWDSDVTVNDFAFGCQAMPITTALLRTRSFGCTTLGMTLQSKINPK